MSSSELPSFAIDGNGERYFVDIKDQAVYYKRAAGYHNIGGKSVPGTEYSIARLLGPNPNIVIPLAEAIERLAMTDEMLEALKRKRKGKKGARKPKAVARATAAAPRARVKRTDAERVALELARLGVEHSGGVIKATRTRRGAIQQS